MEATQDTRNAGEITKITIGLDVFAPSKRVPRYESLEALDQAAQTVGMRLKEVEPVTDQGGERAYYLCVG